MATIHAVDLSLPSVASVASDDIVAGVGTLVDYTNTTGKALDTVAVQMSAPASSRVSVKIEGVLIRDVFVNGPVTWWTQAGNKFLKRDGLGPGERLLVTCDAPAAITLDWHQA